jgi:hypothetical protein
MTSYAPDSCPGASKMAGECFEVVLDATRPPQRFPALSDRHPPGIRAIRQAMTLARIADDDRIARRFGAL